jgi:hypothetical protein
MAKRPSAAGARGARGASGATGARPKRGTAAKLPHDSGPKFEERNIPYFDDAQFKGKLDEVGGLAAEIRGLQQRKAKLEEMIAEKNVIIKALMMDVKDSESWSVRADDWTATFIKPKPRETLVPELLITAGVSLAQLEKGTKRTPVSPYVTIKARGED